jgi:uncharacterized protein YbjT (DUF2867 family)
MENKKNIFVTGITGNQGSAVTRYLLDNGHNVIGLTRNSNSEKAQHWKNQGVKIIEGNLNDSSTYQSEMNKSDAIYFVQSLQGKNSEIKQGKRFIDTIATNDVGHLVYASVLGADLNTGVPHFDSKYEIEKYIRSSNINYTIIRPASFYENHLNPQVANGIKKGKYTSPLNKTCKQQMIGIDDIGKISAQVISNPQKYSGRTLSIATDENQIGNIPQLFSEAIKRPVKYKKLPGFIVRLVMGNDLHKMFKYMNQNDFCVLNNVQDIRDEFSINGDFKNWIRDNFTPKNP